MLLGEMAIVFASGVLVYVLISRTAGPELLGHYSLALSWVTLFQAFAGFGMAEWVMREVGRAPADGGPVGEALALGGATSLVASLVMVAAASFWDYAPEVRRAIVYGALAPPAFTVSQVCRGAFVARGRSQHAMAIRVLEFFAIVPANAIQIVRGAPVSTLIATVAVGRILGAVASLLLLRVHALRIPLPRRLPVWGRLGVVAPFAVSQALGLLATNMNLILLSAWASGEVLGYYGGAAKLVDVLLLAPAVMGTFLLPRLAEATARVAAGGPAAAGSDAALRTWRHAFRGFFTVGILACAGIALFAGFVLRVVYGPRLEPAAPLLAGLMLYCVLVFADSMTSVVLKATDHQRADVLLFSVNPLLNAVLDLVWIPRFGAPGAVAASIVAVLASLSLRYRFVGQRLGPPRWGALAAGPLAAAAVGAAGIFALRGRVAEPILFAAWTFASALVLARVTRVRIAGRGPRPTGAGDVSRRTDASAPEGSGS